MTRQLRRQAQRLTPPPSELAPDWLDTWWSARTRESRPKRVISLEGGPGNFTMDGYVPWPRLGPHHSPRDPSQEARYEPSVRDPAPEQIDAEIGRALARGAFAALKSAFELARPQ